MPIGLPDSGVEPGSGLAALINRAIERYQGPNNPNLFYPYPRANIRTFGAVMDGITDDSAAWQAAISSFGTGQGIVEVPPGVSRITGTITINNMVGIHIAGSGRYTSSVLIDNTTANIFSFLNTQLFSVRGLEIYNKAQRTSGSVFYLANSIAGYFEDIRIQSPFIGWSLLSGSSQIDFQNIWFVSQNDAWQWSEGIYAKGVSGLSMRNIQIARGAASVIDSVISIDSSVDTVLIEQVQGGGDGSLLHGGSIVRLQNLSPGFAPRWVRMRDIMAEGGSSPCIRIDDGLDVELHGCQGEVGQNGLFIGGGNAIRVYGGNYSLNGQHGIRINDGNDILIMGPEVSGNSASITKTYSGISVGTAADLVRIIAASITPTIQNINGGGGIHRFGITFDGGTVKYRQALFNTIKDFDPIGGADIFDGTQQTAAPGAEIVRTGSGIMMIGTNTAATIPLGAIQDLPAIPNMAGIPIGVPTLPVGGAIGPILDSTDGRVYYYYGGAWHYHALT